MDDLSWGPDRSLGGQGGRHKETFRLVKERRGVWECGGATVTGFVVLVGPLLSGVECFVQLFQSGGGGSEHRGVLSDVSGSLSDGGRSGEGSVDSD